MTADGSKPAITGRCYCGSSKIIATRPPIAVAYCHCSDCRRVTGAPVAAFASFKSSAITFSPNEGRLVQVNPGVKRTFCNDCGSPLSGRYDYLPDTVYVPVGLLDQVNNYPPELHAHHEKRVTWLRLEDDLECHPETARNQLNK